MSVEEARDALARYPDFDTVGYGRGSCVLKEEQRVIGLCGVKYLDDLDAVDVGYRLLPEYWGRGLATEACLASVEFGFDVLKLGRIIGLVLADNAASICVLEKVGMQLERGNCLPGPTGSAIQHISQITVIQALSHNGFWVAFAICMLVGTAKHIAGLVLQHRERMARRECPGARCPLSR